MRFIIPLILIVALFTSCKKQYKEQNKQIDELLEGLRQSNKTLTEVDTAIVFELADKVRSDLQLLHQNVDTLELEFAIIIADAYGERNKLFYFKDNYPLFIKELNVSNQQVNKLKQDLNNNLFSDEKFNKYYQQEKAIIINLNEKIAQVVKDLNEAFDAIIKNTSTVDSLLIKLQESKEDTETNE